MWQDRGPGRALLEGFRSAFVVSGALALCSAAPRHASGQEMSTVATPSGSVLGAACALPYLHGSRGSDCGGWHRIVYSTSGASPDAIVRAELLAMALDGTVIQAIPVKIGDQAHLASRIGQRDLKVMSKGDKHQVFAPVPMLRITVEDDGKKAQAFCSNIPYLQLVESAGAVVTESGGNTTNLLAAIPRVQADSLALRVDGVNVFEALGVSPSSCTPGSPCGGTVNVGGTPVHVSSLIVDSGAIEVSSSNSVRMTLDGLGCGGHIHRLDGHMQPGALRSPTSSSCNVDDLADQGTSSVFGITIQTPTEQSANNPVPTPVVGEVCAGRDIVSVKLNGAPASLLGKVFTPGDGVTTGDKYVVPINASLGETDLERDISAGDVPLGTFDAGSNRLVASAEDDQGNRAYARRVFATGNVAPVAVDPQAVIRQPSLNEMLHREIAGLVAPQIMAGMNATSTEIDNAFVVGLSAAGAQKLFTQLCTRPNPDPNSPSFGKSPGTIFDEKVTAGILAIPPFSKGYNGGCSCNPNVTIAIKDVIIDPNQISCPIAFSDGKFRVTINLPDVTVKAGADGSCRTEVLGVCTSETKVDIDAQTTISNIRLEFDVTEDNLLNNSTSPSLYVKGTSSVSTSGGVEVNCLASVCNWVIEGLVTVFTFGTVDLDLTPTIDISSVQDFTRQVGASEPDPVRLRQIKVDEEVVANFDQKLSGNVSSVEITPAGIVAGLKGRFATTLVDTEVESTPGVTLTPAPLPAMPVPAAKDVFIGLADDTVNMLFASMTAAGRLRNECVDTGKDIGDLLPADCESILLKKQDGTDNLLATALARGACYGVKGADCESILMPAAVSDPNDLNTATEQGVCHAFQGANCNAIPLPVGPIAAGVEKATCTTTPNPNLQASQPLLFCTRQDVPPRMLLEDATSSTATEAALRLNDLSVALVVDKTGGGLDGVLADTPQCFGSGVNTAVDCNLFAVCLDLNLNFDMEFETCQDGKPGFVSRFKNLQVLNREPGLVCGGSSSATTDSTLLEGTSTDETVTLDLGNKATDFSPPICGAGLTLGGFVTCTSPSLITINTDASPVLKDYIGITCQVEP